MAILLLINLKGGVAKTTNAVAIAECLAAQGHRTLLIDADHQGMSGELLLGELRLLRSDRDRKTLHDLLAAMLDEGFSTDQFERVVARKASNIGGGLEELSVVPCSIRIDDFQTNMAKARRGYQTTDHFLARWGRQREKMRRWLQQNFDYTIIDCPPSLAVQVRFFLSVAEAFIVPSVPDRLSVRGSLYLLNRLGAHGYKIAPLGTLWSLYREQNVQHRRIVEGAAARKDRLALLPEPFETVIPNATKIAEAAEPDQHPNSFRAKYGPFARLYESLCDEVISRSNDLLGQGDESGQGQAVLSAT
jgi:chromosome partitioning protein